MGYARCRGADVFTIGAFFSLSSSNLTLWFGYGTSTMVGKGHPDRVARSLTVDGRPGVPWTKVTNA